MKVSLRNNKGFSLVELMVVVAIIGILAAIAIPNFQRFTAKSKQAEAKADLAVLFSGERAFEQEWQMYSSSFTHVGYQPRGTYRYQHGFAAIAAAVPPVNYAGPPAVAGDMDTVTLCGQGVLVAGAACTVITTPLPPNAYTAPIAIGKAPPTFLAGAIADISGGAAPEDEWSMNDLKTMTNVVSGLP